MSGWDSALLVSLVCLYGSVMVCLYGNVLEALLSVQLERCRALSQRRIGGETVVESLLW